MNTWFKSLVMSLFLTLTFVGCGGGGGSSSGGDDSQATQAAYEKNLRGLYDAKIKSAVDENASLEPIIDNNIKQASEKFANAKLNDNDMAASLTGHNLLSPSFDISKVKIVKVTKNAEFSDSMNVFYYTVANPITGNDQLLAYDLNSKKAFVVNTDMILESKVFIYSGEKDGDKVKYTARKYGLYLDPTLEKETRKAMGKYGPTIYDFYKDNALMKFNPSKPGETSYIFKSSDIPQALKDSGIVVLGKDFKVFENVVDSENSYVNLKGFDSLADLMKGESEKGKKQTDILVRLSDSKAIQGKAVSIVKDTDGTTSYLIGNTGDVHTPNQNEKSNYKLVTFDKDLQASTFVADGEYFYATQNNKYVYLLKEGNNNIWAFDKAQRTLTKVNGATLAGNFQYDVHKKAAGHGSNSSLIDGATTLSGANSELSDGESAYFSFNYDLIPNVGEAFMFGKFGAYKNSQVFKLSGINGAKIFDNGDGNDDSLNESNTEPIKGHVNLIATKNNKIFVELGWYDNSCTEKYPSPKMPNAGQKCIAVKYGTLDTTKTGETDLIPLKYNTANIEVKELPFYIARRIAPVAVNDKVFISTFAGGTSKTGYSYNQYTFDFNSNTTSVEKNGRTFFTQSAKRSNGIYDGEVIIWDHKTQTINNSNGELIVNTNDINGNPGFSIHAFTNGVPLAGIGTVGMLSNNIGGSGHKFELFLVDVLNKELHYVELAPYSSWLYE